MLKPSNPTISILLLLKINIHNFEMGYGLTPSLVFYSSKGMNTI